MVVIASDAKGVPEVNIGIVGHVDHGKTTLVAALTGKFTDEHSEELKRGITIRLGYADIAISKCPKCRGNLAYGTTGNCFHCGSKAKRLRTVSLVDVPGHETLMATVLTGSALMDGAILLIAANEPCPQPQTEEHLEVLNIAGVKNIVIVQNKIDVVSPEEAKKNCEQIRKLVKGTVAENAPIIPVSAQHRANIGIVFEAVEDVIKTPARDLKKDAVLLVARSFDVNRPGTSIEKLKGGVIGGGLTQGSISVGDEIEILPGLQAKQEWSKIVTKVRNVQQGGADVKTGKPGGLLAVETGLDPSLTKSDRMAGSVAGKKNTLPAARDELKLQTTPLERMAGGVKTGPVKQGDALLMNVGTQRTVGVCVEAGKVSAFKLKRPVSVSRGDRVALSRQVEGRWRLTGYGVVAD